MALVSTAEVLDKAHEGHYVIGAFNISNLEWAKIILLVAGEAKSPVMLGISEDVAKYMCGFKVVVATVKEVHDSLGITVSATLHLDHGSYEGTKTCIEAGFTPAMFDGLHYAFEENLAKSKEMIELAHSKGLSIECEVDGISDEEDGIASMGELADPQECKTVVELGADFLAAEIGNTYGKYPADWADLNFKRLGEIQNVANGGPLVLHGGPGISTDQITRAISLGVSKINVNTELQLVFTDATCRYVETEKDLEDKSYDPCKLPKPGYDAIKDKVTSMMREFGPYGKAE